MTEGPGLIASEENGSLIDQNQNSSNNKNKKMKWCCTEMLSDEILTSVLFTFIHDAKTLALLTAVNKRFQSLLQDEMAVARVVKTRMADNNHSSIELIGISTTEGWTWKELGFYQAVAKAGLFGEHRIGFEFAETDIDTDEDSEIAGNMARIDATGAILQTFEDATLTVEAHCGTAAPAYIAPEFSRARGESVRVEVLHSNCVTETAAVDERIMIHSWGKLVAQRAVTSSHKFREIAREGRGWVEVYLRLGDNEFPKRPSYYEGLEPPELDDNGEYDEDEDEDDAPIMIRII